MLYSLIALQPLTSVRHIATSVTKRRFASTLALCCRHPRFLSASSTSSVSSSGHTGDQEYTKVAIDLAAGSGCRNEQSSDVEDFEKIAEALLGHQTDSECYQHTGNVHLYASMQSNVPEPYNRQNRSPNHLNMPLGGVISQQKYLSNAQINAHPSRNFGTSAVSQNLNVKRKETAHNADGEPELRGSDQVSKSNPDGELKLSQRERFKKAVREYGATVIVFHTSISLFTLGVSYLAVSSGVDVVGLMAKIGVGQSILESKLATGTSTFVVAYACHKVFAPVRMACTLTATPFIVRYLRRVGVLKDPIAKS